MNPDEIIARLRDIHQPLAPEVASTFTLAVEPFVVFLLLLVVIAWLRHWRARGWRRQARARIAAALALPDASDRRRSLLGLAPRIARQARVSLRLPASAFAPPAAADDDAEAELVESLRRGIAR